MLIITPPIPLCRPEECWSRPPARPTSKNRLFANAKAGAREVGAVDTVEARPALRCEPVAILREQSEPARAKQARFDPGLHPSRRPSAGSVEAAASHHSTKRHALSVTQAAAKTSSVSVRNVRAMELATGAAASFVTCPFMETSA